MEARFVRTGDVIEGHAVTDYQHFKTSFVGGTVEFYFADRAPLHVKLEQELAVTRGGFDQGVEAPVVPLYVDESGTIVTGPLYRVVLPTDSDVFEGLSDSEVVQLAKSIGTRIA